ncbi:hypothetical protein MPH47_15175 [Psychrobacillus psychrodurans]|uniref:hypothetical protein n=2 Tax=Psychrobacillus TaxID=1221880 RepID=UPI001F4E28F1|nr:hypothetical protein [Psychrobacillus psychrodurans]MCK1998545.1 hypothetical protein [Psychrobacillus psychrodurans]
MFPENKKYPYWKITATDTKKVTSLKIVKKSLLFIEIFLLFTKVIVTINIIKFINWWIASILSKDIKINKHKYKLYIIETNESLFNIMLDIDLFTMNENRNRRKKRLNQDKGNEPYDIPKILKNDIGIEYISNTTKISLIVLNLERYILYTVMKKIILIGKKKKVLS